MLNIEDACRSLVTPLSILMQSLLAMGFLNTKEVLYWGMKSLCGKLRGHVWNGAVSTTSNSLRLVLPMMILTNVYQLMVIHEDLSVSSGLFLLICGLEWS